jgi:hypothetical protein
VRILPDDWFKRFFGNLLFGKRGRGSYFDDMFGGFDQTEKKSRLNSKIAFGFIVLFILLLNGKA